LPFYRRHVVRYACEDGTDLALNLALDDILTDVVVL